MQIKRGFYNLGKISNKLSTSRYTLEKYLHYKDKKNPSIKNNNNSHY